jgi:hypothetical protein
MSFLIMIMNKLSLANAPLVSCEFLKTTPISHSDGAPSNSAYLTDVHLASLS